MAAISVRPSWTTQPRQSGLHNKPTSQIKINSVDSRELKTKGKVKRRAYPYKFCPRNHVIHLLEYCNIFPNGQNMLELGVRFSGRVLAFHA